MQVYGLLRQWPSFKKKCYAYLSVGTASSSSAREQERGLISFVAPLDSAGLVFCLILPETLPVSRNVMEPHCFPNHCLLFSHPASCEFWDTNGADRAQMSYWSDGELKLCCWTIINRFIIIKPFIMKTFFFFIELTVWIKICKKHILKWRYERFCILSIGPYFGICPYFGIRP